MSAVSSSKSLSLFSFLGEHSESKACCSSKESYCVILQCYLWSIKLVELITFFLWNNANKWQNWEKSFWEVNKFLPNKRLFFQKYFHWKVTLKRKNLTENRKLYSSFTKLWQSCSAPNPKISPIAIFAFYSLNYSLVARLQDNSRPKSPTKVETKRKLQQFTVSGWLIINGGESGSEQIKM